MTVEREVRTAPWDRFREATSVPIAVDQLRLRRDFTTMNSTQAMLTVSIRIMSSHIGVPSAPLAPADDAVSHIPGMNNAAPATTAATLKKITPPMSALDMLPLPLATSVPPDHRFERY
jgi:hypothetical protein